MLAITQIFCLRECRALIPQLDVLASLSSTQESSDLPLSPVLASSIRVLPLHQILTTDTETSHHLLNPEKFSALSIIRIIIFVRV